MPGTVSRRTLVGDRAADILRGLGIACNEHAGLAFESEVGRGDPGHTLVDMAEGFGCDMIIMQTSGAGDLRSALLGSVSHSVVHGAAIPVMLVKAVGD